MNKSLLVKVVGGLLVVCSLLGALSFFKGSKTEVVNQPYGSLSSPNIQSPYVDFGGVRHWYGSGTLNQASTTVCSMQAPLSTSTLVYASVTLSTGTTTATVWDIGKSANDPTATTTILVTGSLSGSTLGTIGVSASSTITWGGSVDGKNVFPSAYATSTNGAGTVVDTFYTNRQFLNFKYGGTQGALNVFTGSCKAEWIQNL